MRGDTMQVLSTKGIDEVEHCYFIGRVQGMRRGVASVVPRLSFAVPLHSCGACVRLGAGDEESAVSLSTCNGLKGEIRAHGEHFQIAPGMSVGQCGPALSFAASLLTLASLLSGASDHQIPFDGAW